MQGKSENSAEEKIRILVVQTAYLGDIILTTPLLLGLKAAYPESHLALLTTPVGCSALTGLSELDELIAYDKNGSESGWRAFLRKVEEVRGKKFELALSAHRSYRSALLLALSGIPVLVGFEDASLSWIYHLRVKRRKEEHEVLRNLSLLEPVIELPGNFEPRVKLPLPLDFSLDQFGIRRDGRLLIGFAPGSAWPTKRWPAERYSELAEMLCSELDAQVVLLGDESDARVCAEVSEKSKAGLFNLAGRTSLPELFGVISSLDALVSNDSAPVHVASAFGVPAVVIFGPTSPKFGFGPWRNPSRVLEKELACRPCHHHGPRECPEVHFRCMKDISAGEVAEAVRQLVLEKKRV